VLVLTMPDPRPVGLVGDLIGAQALNRGVAAILVDAAVRDVDELREMGLPVWTRFVRAAAVTRDVVGALDEPVEVGDARISSGDIVVLDADGAVVVPADRIAEVLKAAQERLAKEDELRDRIEEGKLTYDLHGLRALVEQAQERR
jgi:4-hydroxy-4-methyl-2-oxoglutarate aldolase